MALYDVLRGLGKTGAPEALTGIGSALMAAGAGGGPVRSRFAAAAPYLAGITPAIRGARQQEQMAKMMPLQRQLLEAQVAKAQRPPPPIVAGYGSQVGAPGAPGSYRVPDKPTALSAKIDEIMASQNVDRKTAAGIALRVLKTTPDNVYGGVNVTNLASGQSKYFPPSEPSGEMPLPKKEKAKMAGQNVEIENMLSQFDDLEKALPAGVGAMSVAKEFSSKTLGQLPTAEFDIPILGRIGTGTKAEQKKTTDARQRIALLKESLMKTLAKNPKVSLAEQERIAKLLPGSGIFESEAHAKNSLAQVRSYLENILKTNKARISGKGRKGPAIGTIQDGYKFNGGDPSKPQNWSKQ